MNVVHHYIGDCAGDSADVLTDSCCCCFDGSVHTIAGLDSESYEMIQWSATYS